MNGLFGRIARRAAHLAGTAWAFLLAFLLVVTWAITGPLFHFSATWQLVINTGTTIITFLMVFLIQSSQNRDSAAMQLKLDELLRAVNGAHNSLISLESSTEEEIERQAQALHRLVGLHDDDAVRGRHEAGAPVKDGDGAGVGTSAGTGTPAP